MVELHYSILVIGWYFSVENVGILRVDVLLCTQDERWVCFDDGSCSRVYKEVLYRFIWSRSMLRCCNGMSSEGWCFSAEGGGNICGC